MKVTEIRGEAELQDLRSAWEALLRESASDTVFLTWEWVSAWWSAYGQRGELRVLAVFDESGVLRGIAPLRSRVAHKFGQSVPALSFVGDGSNDSEYLDFIAAAGYEQQVMGILFSYLEKELNQGTVLLLNEMPAASVNYPWLKKLAEDTGAAWKESEVACGTVRLPESWEEYLSTLRPRFRTKVRSVLRSLEARKEVRFGFCETSEDLGRMLPVMYDLHKRRWAQDAKPGVFGWDRKREFYAALSPLLLERGWLRFSWLEWNGVILACQYGFVYGGRYFHLQEGYEPASEHWNVGAGLRAWSIRQMLSEVREYDFLGGVGRHKTDWGAETKFSKHLLIAKASYKNLLLRRGPEWETQVRESIRNVVPERILTARHERMQRQSLDAHGLQNGHHAESSALEWAHQAAAHCYFHLGLSKLVRPLRERYQVSIQPEKKWPPIVRRRGASARILYYHRVNDENDPFFPAISTELFEQEMRYVARHHKVVPLAELVERLSGGSTDPVLAISFDDGYQDNYLNAFPILQRYGLPATIFLTTGSMDSGEPLWFELMASAIEKTSREFIDLELDLPRRFWLRTPAERLDSNNRIFAFLRQMPDTERKHRLAEILRQLAAGDDSKRKNKMLTWDQVRDMKRHGIDFGGHTVTHPFLSKLDRDQMGWEVSECKRRIEVELQRPIEHFAYPNGREEDFTQWNKDLLRQTGYRAAVTTVWGLNFSSTDLMELRRGGPWEESPAVFAYKLDWYQLSNG